MGLPPPAPNYCTVQVNASHPRGSSEHFQFTRLSSTLRQLLAGLQIWQGHDVVRLASLSNKLRWRFVTVGRKDKNCARLEY